MVTADQERKEELTVATASRVQVQIRDESGGFSPGKVQFLGVDGTPTPNLGTPLRAHGSDRGLNV